MIYIAVLRFVLFVILLVLALVSLLPQFLLLTPMLFSIRFDFYFSPCFFVVLLSFYLEGLLC